MANLTDKEKMRVFGLCNGSMLLGVNTPCALGDEVMRATLTWFNTRVLVDRYGEYRSGTGRCGACETVNAKNKKTTVPERYLQVCANDAARDVGEPVQLVQEAFDKVLKAEGYEEICQVCRQGVVWLQGRTNTASMNRTVDLFSYMSEEQQLEVNCLCCNRGYEGYFGGDPKEIQEKIGSYSWTGKNVFRHQPAKMTTCRLCTYSVRVVPYYLNRQVPNEVYKLSFLPASAEMPILRNPLPGRCRNTFLPVQLYIRSKKFDPTGDVRSQLKKPAEDEDRLIIDLDLDTHITYCLSRSKSNAKTKKTPHHLVFDYMKKLILTQYFGCALSGILGVMKKGKWNSFSINKIVQGYDIGYVKGNVQWVILPMNHGKNRYKDEDFRKHLKKIYT